MNARIQIVTAVSICAVITIGIISQKESLSSSGIAFSDPVVASFKRELAHSPAPTKQAQRPDIEGDILYRELNSVHWTDSSSEEAP